LRGKDIDIDTLRDRAEDLDGQEESVMGKKKA